MYASVLLVDDDPAILAAVGDYLLAKGFTVTREPAGEPAKNRFVEDRADVVILDLYLPDVQRFELLEWFRDQSATVIVLTGHGDIPTAVEAMQHGAENFLAKPVDMEHLTTAVARAAEKVQLQRQVAYLRTHTQAHPELEALGTSPAMRAIADQVELLAKSPRTTSLLTGESGTGKGYLARLIHDLSARAAGPFVEVNCGGLTRTFLDSELFGHERGAFTDAKTMKQGLFELADGGTLFLDEIGDLAPELQPKLLRVLESKSFRRVGGTREIEVDVRLIAATNSDLTARVSGGTFRHDLFYRLSVLPLHLPAVRDRTRGDRIALLERLLADLTTNRAAGHPGIESAALDRLVAYPWPGNIREMRNVLERALILAGPTSPIGLSHLPVEVRGGRRAADDDRQPLSLKELEKRHIHRTLGYRRGNRTHAARDLGITRATLIKKIKDYGLD